MHTSSPRHTPRPSRRLWLWWIPVLAAVALWGIRQAIPAADGLDARYFRSLRSGDAVAITAIDSRPSTHIVTERWGSAMPETFSVTWRGYLAVSSPGTYEFATTSDDGSQLFIDDRLVVDNGGRHSRQTRTGTARLTSGSHRLMLVYTQEGGDLHLDWSWRRDDGGASSVPAWLLSRRPASYATALAAHAIDLALRPLIALAALGLAVGGVLSLRSWRPGPIALPAPRFLSGTTARVAVLVMQAAAIVLPLALFFHALAFWGKGVIDEEATTFVINYLAKRPFLQMILDPNLNDWGSFQARELAYVFDRMDARVFTWVLVDRHTLLFVPLSSVLSLLAIAAVYLAGATRVLRLDRITSLLLLALFLSCIVTQASTPVLYRSSKMLLSVAALAFLFLLITVVASVDVPRVGRATVLVVLGVLMSMCDRQGYAFLLASTTVVAFLWLRDRVLGTDTPRAYGTAAIAAAAATLGAILYNNVTAPNAILLANGYWPDMSYEDIPFERFNALLARDAWAMFRGQVSFFFGNLPFWAVCVMGLLVWTAVVVRRPDPSPRPGVLRLLTGTGLVVTCAIAGALLVLIAVMGMRHPPVFQIVDHAYWYYTLSMQAILLFAASLAVTQLLERGSATLRGYVWLALLAMIAGNAAHYPAQRQLMEASGDWFGKQHAFAQLYARAFEAAERDAPETEWVLPSWVRVHDNTAEAHFPVHDYGLLDAFKAGYATLHGRAPLADAGGPYWRELRNFMDGSASPFLEPGSIADGLRALQSVGVRRFVIHRADVRPPASVEALIDAARQLGPLVTGVEERDGLVVLRFDDDRRNIPNREGWTPIPAGTFTLSASQSSDQLGHAVDDDPATEWNSVTRQTGTEWIAIELDRPRDVAAVRLNITDQALDRYPRRLSIESTGPSGTRSLYEDGTLPALAYGLLTQPVQAPIEIALPANSTSKLVIRQTGASPAWGWAVRELKIFERASRDPSSGR